MANKRADTMSLSGNDYAKVPERIKLFREDCPNGSIRTSFNLDNDTLVFTATIIKDKSDPSSADATGHSMAKMTTKQKEFEKQETIAVGRALALLGYLASGEIASSEEMEEFNSYKKEQRAEAVANTIADMGMATTIEEVRKIGRESNLLNEPKVVEAGKKRVAEITAKGLKNEDN